MVSGEVGQRPTPVGYRLIVPSEWERIPLRSGSEEAVRGILDRAFAELARTAPPAKLIPFRREAEKRLLRAASEARSANGIELYIPVRETGGTKLAASFVVSSHRMDREIPSDPLLIAGELANAEAESAVGHALRTMEVDGALTVRREWAASADPSRGVETGSRRVDYFMAVPHDPRRWLGVSFSGIGSGDPHDTMADALVEWFDALMETFVWRYA